MSNERFYVSKGKIRDKQKPNDWFTVKEVCALLNKQNKLLTECEKEFRKYDGRKLFTLDFVVYANILNKINEVINDKKRSVNDD